LIFSPCLPAPGRFQKSNGSKISQKMKGSDVFSTQPDI
jgi:hypothetical protein